MYVPSRVRLFKFSKVRKAKEKVLPQNSVPEKHHTTKEPVSLLVTEILGRDLSSLLGVHYLGETWYVEQKDVYEL